MNEKIRRFFKKFFSIKDTPHKIAAGAALGIFLGIVPGEGVLTTLILASIFRFNRVSALAGVVSTNMWATVAISPLAAGVGSFLFGENSQKLIQEFHLNYHLGIKFFLTKAILLDVALPLVTGFFIVAGSISLAFYFLLFLSC